jgi:hypothetical protein
MIWYKALKQNMSWKRRYIRIRQGPTAMLEVDIRRHIIQTEPQATTKAVPADPRLLLHVAANGPGKAASRKKLVVAQSNGHRRRYGVGAIQGSLAGLFQLLLH